MRVEDIEEKARRFDHSSLTAKERKLLVSLVVKYRNYYYGVVAFLLQKESNQ